MAKQILPTPMSTIAIEQEFSIGDNILDATRSFMSPDSIETQACVDNWIRAKFWQQEIDQEPTYKYFKNNQTTGTEDSEY